METLKYYKVRKVKTLNRAHPDDAGIDFYIPEDLDVETFRAKCDVTGCYVNFCAELHYDGKSNIIRDITLRPGESVLIPSGIHVKVPTGHALIYFNKSGVASKKHLHVGACVVDSSYTGECHINLTNTGKTDITISAGEKIVQGIVVPINFCQTEEINSLEELYTGFESSRKAGGFGSTNAK